MKKAKSARQSMKDLEAVLPPTKTTLSPQRLKRREEVKKLIAESMKQVGKTVLTR